MALAVKALGADRAGDLAYFQPGAIPIWCIESGYRCVAVVEGHSERLDAFRTPLKFTADELGLNTAIPKSRARLGDVVVTPRRWTRAPGAADIGSNNCVVSGGADHERLSAL